MKALTPAGADTQVADFTLDELVGEPLGVHVNVIVPLTTPSTAVPDVKAMAVVDTALATGSGPTTPNSSDPTSTSNTEVLLLLDDEYFLCSVFKYIFEALSFDFRARIKEITRE